MAFTLLCVLPEAELAFGVSGGTQSREKLWLGTAKGQHPLCVLSGVLCPLKLLSCFSPLCRHPLEVQGAVQHGLFREVVAKKRGCKVSPALFSPFSWGALERWQLSAFGAIPVSRRGFGTPPCPPVLLSTTPLCPPRCPLTPGCQHYKSHSFKLLLVWCQPGALGMLCPLLGTAHSEALL